MRYPTRWPLLIAVCSLLTGCASMAANQAETAKWQAKADAATRAVGAGDVAVLLARRAGYGGVYYYQSRTLEVDPIDRDPRDVERIFAHELSHHLLGHRGAMLEQEIAATSCACRTTPRPRPSMRPLTTASSPDLFSDWG